MASIAGAALAPRNHNLPPAVVLPEKLVHWSGGTIPGAFGFLAGGPNFASTAFAGAASLRNQSLSYGADYVATPRWLVDFRLAPPSVRRRS